MSTVILAIRVGLAGVFALAGIAKLLDLEGSRGALRDFGFPKRTAAVAGLILPLAEIATAVALVPASSARWGAVAALALLLAFIAGIANSLRQGQTPDCHCFGQIHSAPAGRGTLARNGVLAILATVVVASGPGPAVDTWVEARTAAELVAVGTGICAVVFGLAWLQLWRQRRGLLRDLSRAQRQATSAPPGVPIGSPAPGFSLPTVGGDTITLDSLRERGLPILLVFIGPACDSCLELMPKLSRWQASLSERLTIALISTGTPEENLPLCQEYGVEDMLLQERFDVSDTYRIRGTPSGVILTPEGTVASNPAETVFGMEPLLRLALREGVRAPVENPVA